MNKRIQKFLKWYKKLSLVKRGVIALLVLLFFIFIFPSLIKNTPFGRPEVGQGEYYFVSHSQDLIPGQTFTVELRIRAKTAVNAIGARLSYNPNIVEILNMNTEESFCSFYLDNSFDNIKGSIDLSCGKETPGFQGDATVMVLHLRSKTHGKAVFSVLQNGSQILANDGKGTDILNDYPSLNIEVKKSF